MRCWLLRLQRFTVLDRCTARKAQYTAAQRRNAAYFQTGKHPDRTAQTCAQQSASHRIHGLLVGQRLTQLSFAPFHRHFTLVHIVGDAGHLFALLHNAAMQSLKDAVQILQILMQTLQLMQANGLCVQLMSGWIEITLDGWQLALLLLGLLQIVVMLIAVVIVSVEICGWFRLYGIF